MSAEQARKVAGAGPRVGPAGRGARGGAPGAPAAPQAGRGGGRQGSGYNCIFVGSKGYLGTNGRGEDVGLLPGSKWAEYKLPNAYLQRSPGASTGDNHSAHCRDWVRACKGGAPACSSFSIAGPYTEWLVLGAVATHFDGKMCGTPIRWSSPTTKTPPGGSSPPSAKAGKSSDKQWWGRRGTLWVRLQPVPVSSPSPLVLGYGSRWNQWTTRTGWWR